MPSRLSERILATRWSTMSGGRSGASRHRWQVVKEGKRKMEVVMHLRRPCHPSCDDNTRSNKVRIRRKYPWPTAWVCDERYNFLTFVLLSGSN